MAKRIEGNEIINDSWAAKAVKQGEDLLKVLEKLEEQGKQTADQLSKVAKTQSGATAKSIRDITQAVSKSNAERKKSIAIDNEKKSLEEKLTRLRSNKIQQNEQLKVLISEQRRVNKQLAREATGVAGAYEKESKTLIKLRKRLKDLIITEGEGSKKTQELKRRVTELDQKLKSADAAAGQFQRNVGNYPKAMGGAIASLKKFAGALGIVGGVQLLNRGLRNTFDIVKNFDQAQANLASVLGVTRDEMSGLTEMAKELGATTKFTASEVSELQLEFAKLGFTQKEIEGVTEATLQLAAASGTDLGNAASITGSTIRAFGLDVSETQRVVDVMAQSFSASSLDINKFQTAMGSVAPVAASAGLSVEETTAMLGTLTDAGIDASTAGTGLRNVYLELSKTGMTFEEAMNQISSASDKNAASLELFGKRGATIGTVLANSGSQIDALTERLNNAGGAAQEMADKQLDTLQGSLELLNSAWEGYILGADGANGVSEQLKNVVQFLAENLETILDTTVILVKTFVSYKVATFAATVAVRAYTAVQTIATKGLRAFNTAAKLNPFGLIISGLVLVTSLFGENTEATDENTEATDENTEARSEQDKAIIEQIKHLKELNAQLNEGSKTINQLSIKDLKALREEYKENLDVTQSLVDLYGIQDKQLIGSQSTFEDYLLSLLKSTDITNEGINALHDRRDALLRLSDVENQLAKLGQDGTKTRGTTRTRTKKEVDLDKQRYEDFKKNLEDNIKQREITLRSSGATEEEISDALLNYKIDNLKKEKEYALKNFGEYSDEYINANLELLRKIDSIKESNILNDDEVSKQRYDDFLKNQENNLKIIKNNLIKEGKTSEEIEEELSKQRITNLREELDFTLNEFGQYSEEYLDARDKLNDAILNQDEKLAKKQLEMFKKTSKNISNIVKDLANNRIKSIEDEIKAAGEQISKSENEVARLQEIGTAQAIKSAEAEQKRIDKEKNEIEALEKKKRNLLILTTGLERVNQLIQSGDLNPFQTTGGEIGNFISQLASFYDGTELTVADSLGKTGTKDGHIVRVHDNEHIVSAKDSDRLHANGIYKTSDIVDSALNWKNLNTSSLIMNKRNSDAQLISEVKEMRKAFNSIDFPEQYVYLDRDVFKKQNSIKTVNYSNNRI